MTGGDLKRILQIVGMTHTAFGARCRYGSPNTRIGELVSGKVPIPEWVEKEAAEVYRDWRMNREVELKRELAMLKQGPEVVLDVLLVGERKMEDLQDIDPLDETILKELKRLRAQVNRMEEAVLMRVMTRKGRQGGSDVA